MIRNVDISEISDGRLYGREDMVRLDCGGCEGCSACCRQMGDSIVLDPLDVHRLEAGCNETFSSMLDERIELGMVDNAILPHLKLKGEEEACSFLNEKGRCSIHPYRPGFCRLFPLGRYYQGEGFSYILQKGECPREGGAKIKVRRWVDTPDLPRYEAFVLHWHHFIRRLGALMPSLDGQTRNDLALYVLRLFYEKGYSPRGDFYTEFDQRLSEAREVLADLEVGE